MTKDDVIRMAREAGIEFQQHTGLTGRVRTMTCGSQAIEKIESLVKAAIAAGADAELRRLHAANQELLEALKLAWPQLIGHAERTARAAIAKAEGT